MTVQVQVVRIRGRKRKAGKRLPCGKLSPIAKGDDAQEIARRMQHRAGVPECVRHDPKAESLLGRLALWGRITDAEYDAGVWWRSAVGRYRMLIDAPRASPPSLGAEMVASGRSCAVPDPGWDDRVRRDYDDGYCALMMGGGIRGARAVSHIAIFDRWCVPEHWRNFRYALAELAGTRGMMSQSARADLRNSIGFGRSRG